MIFWWPLTHRDDLRPGHHRRDRQRYDRLPCRLFTWSPEADGHPGQALRRERKGSNSTGRGNPYLDAAVGDRGGSEKEGFW
jgi:hypothetical protein